MFRLTGLPRDFLLPRGCTLQSNNKGYGYGYALLIGHGNLMEPCLPNLDGCGSSEPPSFIFICVSQSHTSYVHVFVCTCMQMSRVIVSKA